MANPYPVELRERAVRAFEDATETYEEVAARFSLHVNTLVRWVQRVRETGSVAPERQRGWLALTRRHLVAPCARQGAAGPNDRRTELSVQPTARLEARVHRSSIPRTLQRSGYVFKKENGRDRRNRIVRRPRGATAPQLARTRLPDVRVTGEKPLIDRGTIRVDRGAT